MSSSPLDLLNGLPEIIAIDSTDLGITDGYFSLTFGNENKLLSATAKVEHGDATIYPSEDLTPFVLRGDFIEIDGITTTIAENGLMSSHEIPLSSSFPGMSSNDASIHVKKTSVLIPFDADDYIMQRSLQLIPDVNLVTVRREEGSIDGYKWFVTFDSNIGPQPSFQVNTKYLIGTNAEDFKVETIQSGILPQNYVSIEVGGDSSEYTLDNLQAGVKYFISVRAKSKSKLGLPTESSPLYLKPAGVPGEPKRPFVKAISNETIQVVFEETTLSNGNEISLYNIEVSGNEDFEYVKSVSVPVSNKIQRIATNVHTLPWDPSSTFTLSLGHFDGKFVKSMSSSTTVNLLNGSHYIQKSAGSDDISALLTRGDTIRVGGRDYSVCLDRHNQYDYNSDSVPLCLLGTDDVAIYSGKDLTSVPVFLSDTSLGSVKEPTLGETFLNTIDSAGNDVDSTQYLKRGDYLRIGDPTNGETYRVSTDLDRAFTSKLIPLASVDDSNMEASLTEESLKYSSYEIQVLKFTASSASQQLTPSSHIMSSYRLKFGSEVTKECMPWDGSALVVKEQLESLLNVDHVLVSKSLLSEDVGVNGEGVEYKVTFVGDNVRGNVPSIQFHDVGKNGCDDASTAGGKFIGHLGLSSVQVERISFVPIYMMQTTNDIPFDATEVEMKEALESLSQVCKVDVTKSSSQNGAVWDVTFDSECENDCGASIGKLIANENNLSASVDPSISIVSKHIVDIEVDQSTSYVRISASNDFGPGPHVLSNPVVVETSNQVPNGPRVLRAKVLSDSEVLVEWELSQAVEKEITLFKVEYEREDGIGSVNYVTVDVEESPKIQDVQTFSIRPALNGVYLGGTFSLSFYGQETMQLPHDATSEQVKSALEDLCVVSEVEVTRHLECYDDTDIFCKFEGFTWIVTFLKPREESTISIHGEFLLSCNDPVDKTNCMANPNDLMLATGPREKDSLTYSTILRNLSSLSDWVVRVFSYNQLGTAEPAELSSIHLQVKSPSQVLDISTSIIDGTTISISFGPPEFDGGVPITEYKIDYDTLPTFTSFKGLPVGTKTSASNDNVLIDNLTPGRVYYVRVAASNAQGQGPYSYFNNILVPSQASSLVETAEFSSSSSTDFHLTWDLPLGEQATGYFGSPLNTFVVEIAEDSEYQMEVVKVFTSNVGSTMGGEFRLSSAFQGASGQEVTISFDASAETFRNALMSLPEYTQVLVSRLGPSPSEGYEWTIEIPLGSNHVCFDPCISISAPSITGIVEIETVQRGTSPVFDNLVMVERVGEALVREEQKIEVSWTGVNKAEGYFSLSFEDIDQSITINPINDNEQDVREKIQRLVKVGSVDVSKEQTESLISFKVTFTSKSGDVSLFHLHDEDKLIGDNVNVVVEEVVKGIAIPQEVDVLLPFSLYPYISRIKSINEANQSSQWSSLPLFAYSQKDPVEEQQPNRNLFAIVPTSNTAQGSFRIRHGESITNEISVNTSADILKDYLFALPLQNISTSTRNGLWLIEYNAETRDELFVNDDNIQGGSVHINPVLSILITAERSEIDGDIIVDFGSEATSFSAVNDSGEDLKQILLKLNGLNRLDVLDSGIVIDTGDSLQREILIIVKGSSIDLRKFKAEAASNLKGIGVKVLSLTPFQED
ncbi:hypothetical protein CTEN210_16526 [Chaetoceros tenuissimus]|uniref:Fibronectin type-III domain-containing protein n=1 Tax=Chaetoceros tenuissimus TaxID=426638 RepID=A0AAD3HDW5_9STRA|nr:hypothetical protein CTEN210_16526 [Chaetoceros tenuissimus]